MFDASEYSWICSCSPDACGSSLDMLYSYGQAAMHTVRTEDAYDTMWPNWGHSSVEH